MEYGTRADDLRRGLPHGRRRLWDGPVIGEDVQRTDRGIFFRTKRAELSRGFVAEEKWGGKGFATSTSTRDSSIDFEVTTTNNNRYIP